MSRTRTIFFLIIGLALMVILVGVAAFLLLTPSQGGPVKVSTDADNPVEVTIVSALSVEPWVSEAARQFNAENHALEGHPIRVNIVAMDGLAAMGRYEREEMDPFPTAWVPDSRYLVELVNATYKTKLGRDVSRPTHRHFPLCLGYLRQPGGCVGEDLRGDQLADNPRCGDCFWGLA
jgi:hypothetical protein